MTYQEIYNSNISFMVYLSGKSPKEIALNMGVSERTFYRYLSQNFVGNRLPILMACGNLGAIDKHFENWRIKKGQLMTPSGHLVHPSEIEQVQYLRNLAFNHLKMQKINPMTVLSPASNDAGAQALELRLIKSGFAGGGKLGCSQNEQEHTESIDAG